MAKLALGTWAWGSGAFGGDTVFGSKTDVENLKPVFGTALQSGLNLWNTATVYGMGESERAGLERMRQYLTDKADLAPYREMILYRNAEQLFGSEK